MNALNSFSRIRAVVTQKTSAGGLGFAGTSGLIASALTDIASLLGPILIWFFVFASIAAIALAILIHNSEEQTGKSGGDPQRLSIYCHTFVVLLGALFGSGVLLIVGLFQGDSEGSRILALLRDTQETVKRIETTVDEIDEQVGGIGQKVVLRDVSGRSGTGMIGDVSTFQISLENERLMQGASCRITVSEEWRSLTNVISNDCSSYKIQFAQGPILDNSGQSPGDLRPFFPPV